jgi:cell division FtsZ-interacting protein ZapD
MDALKLLREQAARKRDKAIQAARNEYQDNLKEIDTLGMRLSLDVRTEVDPKNWAP